MQPNTGSAKTSANGSTAPIAVTTATNSTAASSVKLELTGGGGTVPVATTTAQVITVVAPASSSSALLGRTSVTESEASPSCLPSSNTGNPVLVQVSTGGQLIAVAVSPDSISQSNAAQAPVTSVDTPGTTSDEDGTGGGFDDFASGSYTNGASNQGSMTYFTTENSYQNSTGYYNYATQGVNQIISDGAYLVMEPDGTGASGASGTQRASPQTTLAVTNPSTGVSITPKTVPSTNATAHHQTVRDMDIVHVQWLIENYETAEGVSLPRSTLYTHYQNHCQQQGIEPVNAASFGKLIRSVFIGLRTRRLGTRGNSKYHYYGIRVKPGSSLSRLMDTPSAPTTPDPTPPPVKKAKSGHPVNQSNRSSQGQGQAIATGNSNSGTNSGGGGGGSGSGASSNSTTGNESHQSTLAATSPEILQSHLGDPKSILPSVWPDEPTIPLNTDSDSPSILATKFAVCYRKHYEEIINALGNLNFTQVEAIWIRFWQPDVRSPEDKEQQDKRLCLKLEQLHQLTSTTSSVIDDSTVTSLAEWIIQTDYTLYNALISSLLLPNLLKPIPQQLTQQIRNFAKNVSSWMTSALAGYDETFVALKLAAVGAFSHTLRRYTSLNHLSSAARAVLQNQQQISQMINDLNRVDFKNVQEQASWVCNCDDELVEHIEHSFKSLLQQENPFDRWGIWCDQVLDTCLNDVADVKSAKQFFFKWGFYSSLVMRDLTLRSASSFGSFHLIRLLFDEYIFYLIEHRVAKASSKTPLQVLGEARTLRTHVTGASVESTAS